ncbi:PLC-like phosphodiesterase [Sarocladium strictum]
MPGSHDAGMSTISRALLSLGSEANTQTQSLNIYNQLRAGARWFDVRVASVHQSPSQYRFWALHVNDETADVAIGASGESFNEIISEINDFTDEFPGEVIILQFRYLLGIRTSPGFGPIYWGEDIMEDFLEHAKKINNRCSDLSFDQDKAIERYKMGDLMGRNNGKGCVLLFLDDQHLDHKVPPQKQSSASDGIYPGFALTWHDAWPNKEDTEDVANSAIKAWQVNKGNRFHVGQWLSTPSAATSTFSYSLQVIAVLAINPALYWRGVNEIFPDSFPNVLMVDYLGMVVLNEDDWDQLSAELYTLAIGLNLYLISENCDINSMRSPLLPSRSRSNFRPASSQNPLVSSWGGIIFANGTTIDHPPPGLHPGRVAVLKKGTVFGNRTVLTKDMRNPEILNSTISLG